MAIIKPEQLSSGTYSISGSFSGSFHGDGSNLNNLPSNVISTGSYADFPDTGSEGYIYIDNSANIGYLWDSGSIPPTYVNIAGPSTPPDVLPLTFANAATSLALSPSPLYNNGVSGSGAVLTGSINGVLSDGTNPGKIDYTYTPVVGDVILVKNQLISTNPVTNRGFQNGLYTITSTGSASSKYVLTRTGEYDVSSELYPLQVNVLTGTNNAAKSFIQSTINPVIGTSNLVFAASSAAPSVAPQIAFVDTVIDTPLTNIVYATGSVFALIPGAGATLTSTVPGTLGTWNGLSVNINPNITGSFTKVLVTNQTNPAHNGDYSVLATGSATVFWKLQRINNNASGFDRYTRFFLVSNTSSSKAGRMYFTRPNSPALTNAVIGTAPINIFEYGGGTSTSAFPFTGSALITGSLGVTGSFDILAPPIVNNTAVYAGFRMADVPGAFFQLTNYSTSSGAFIPTIRSFHPPTGTGTGLQLIAQIGNDGAANVNPAMTFNVMSQSAAVGQIRNRPLFTWENNNTSSMALTTVGLAIGSNLLTPSASLHINNTSSFNSFLVEDDTRPDASPFVINNAGRVGIGNTTPTASLDIKASSSAATDLTFRIRNSSDTNNLAVISGVGDILLGSGSSVTTGTGGNGTVIAIGENSAVNSGFNKSPIAIGKNSVSTGNAIAIGNGASNGTGSTISANIAIGENAINLNTTVNCISIGSSVQTGQTANTIAIGGAINFSNYLGGGNIAVGYNFNGGNFISDAYAFGRASSATTLDIANSFSVYINRTTRSFFVNQNSNQVFRNGQSLTPGTHFDASATNTFTIHNGVAPASNITDSFQLYSSASIVGNAVPHFRTGAGNIVKLYSQAAVTSAQGIADALTNLGLLTGSSVIATGSTPGPVGVANSLGVYTYYNTFSASMAAAPTGSTVEFFADIIETGSISVNLRNGVNINGNGHTYTLNTAGTASCVIDNGVAVSCSISNIIFTRLGGTASSTNTLCMYITGGSIIRAYGTKLIGGATNMRCLTINNASAQVFGVYAEGYNPCITVTNGQLFDSTGKSIGGGGITVEANGTAIKCIGYGYGSGGIVSYGKLIDCIGYGQVNGGIASYSGLIQNCTGYGVGSMGLYINGGTTVAINSTGYSLSSEGILTSSNINIGLQGYSTAGPGITLVNGILTNCTGYSTSTNGIYMYNSGATIGELRSCKAISTVAPAIFQNNLTPGSKIYNTEAISRWSNAGGHGIMVSGSNTEIVQCVIETTSPLANCIFPSGSLPTTVKYANNAFKGATVAVNANITQGMINTHDNQGNIII
jgi:hypothetical protein